MPVREHSGSVVECLTRDRGAVGSSLMCVTALWSLNCLVSGIYAGPVPQNQTCAMVNMSADPAAMIPGLLVGRK